jgi:glutaredoxin
MTVSDRPVTLFVVPHCPLCSEARKWLSEHQVDYAEHNVAADWGALREMYEGTRQRYVPVIKVGDTFLIRPSREELRQLLS